MRRAEAILAIVALLATPLALLARGRAGATAICDRVCCLPRGSHSAQARNPADQPEGMSCHHGAAGHMVDCVMKSGDHRADYGLNAPIAPTTPSAIVSLTIPRDLRLAISQRSIVSFDGYRSAPFEPPRT
jgi:hypothetical protein